MKLGETTDTQDRTGTVVSTRPVPAFSKTEIMQTFARFIGTVSQVPPMFSARKIDGARLYKLARQGKIVERPARQVTITQLEILDIALPLISFRVVCSKGTYIRTLAHDIGEALGCVAHLRTLERTQIGTFWLRDAVSLEQVDQEEHYSRKQAMLIPTDQALRFLPAVRLGEQNAGKIIHGARVTLKEGEQIEHDAQHKDDEICRVYRTDGLFLALARKWYRKNHEKSSWILQPLKVFAH
jgi:tRNA pseudouridine55 synthase